MNATTKVLTVQSVESRKIYYVCEKHNDPAIVGNVQVQHGLHDGECDFCDTHPIAGTVETE